MANIKTLFKSNVSAIFAIRGSLNHREEIELLNSEKSKEEWKVIKTENSTLKEARSITLNGLWSGCNRKFDVRFGRRRGGGRCNAARGELGRCIRRKMTIMKMMRRRNKKEKERGTSGERAEAFRHVFLVGQRSYYTRGKSAWRFILKGFWKE